MKKTHRIGIRITDEMRDKLCVMAHTNDAESMSQEVRRILHKALGIKRAKATK